MFFNHRKLYSGNFLQSVFKLDPDQYLKSSWKRIRIEKKCWIQIRKKLMRIQSPGQKVSFN